MNDQSAPWPTEIRLKKDRRTLVVAFDDGVVADLSAEQLRNAPTLRLDEADRPRDRKHDEEIAGYYGRLPWWGL